MAHLLSGRGGGSGGGGRRHEWLGRRGLLGRHELLSQCRKLTAASKRKRPHAGIEKGHLAVAAGDVREGDCFRMHTCKPDIHTNAHTHINIRSYPAAVHYGAT